VGTTNDTKFTAAIWNNDLSIGGSALRPTTPYVANTKTLRRGLNVDPAAVI
jgi:hypothetical protein